MVNGGAARDESFWYLAGSDNITILNVPGNPLVSETHTWRQTGEDDYESVCLGVDVNLSSNTLLYQIVYDTQGATAYLRIYLVNADGTLTRQDNIAITDQSIFDALDPTYRLFPRVIVSLNSDFESQRGIGSIGIVDTTIYIPIGDVERLSTGRKLTQVLAYTLAGVAGSRTLTLAPTMNFELPIGALSPDGIIIFTDGSLWVGFHHTLLRFIEPQSGLVYTRYDTQALAEAASVANNVLRWWPM